jgi:hypothetical protein
MSEENRGVTAIDFEENYQREKFEVATGLNFFNLLF